MAKLKLYVHDSSPPREGGGSWTTTVNLESRHRDFIKRRNVNLSAQVRALLDYLMGQERGKTGEE